MIPMIYTHEVEKNLNLPISNVCVQYFSQLNRRRFSSFQVTPSTIVIPECKEPFHRELTLTPMIPVRKALSVQFYLPDGLWLLDKDDCSISIKGTTPVKVKVGATCTTLYGLAKLKVITPKITNRDESVFWGDFGLPTVWVREWYLTFHRGYT